MRLDRKLVEEAKAILGAHETTATIEEALAGAIRAQKAFKLLQETAGSGWTETKRAFADDEEDEKI